MTFNKAYNGVILAGAFPSLANLYEKVTKKKIPYRNNSLVLAKFPKRKENQIIGARFLPGMLEGITQSNK